MQGIPLHPQMDISTFCNQLAIEMSREASQVQQQSYIFASLWVKFNSYLLLLCIIPLKTSAFFFPLDSTLLSVIRIKLALPSCRQFTILSVRSNQISLHFSFTSSTTALVINSCHVRRGALEFFLNKSTKRYTNHESENC